MSESQNESHPWRETNLNDQNIHPSDSQSGPLLEGQIQSQESRSLELAHTQKQIIHHHESIGDQSTPIHLGLFDETIQQSKKLLALDPGNVDAALNLSYAYKQTQKFEAAKQILESAFEYEPQSPEMLFQLGVLALEMKDYKDSIQWLNRYLKLSPRDEHAYFNLGLAHLESGHLIESMGYYHQALVLNPHLLNAYYELGWIYLNQGLYSEVIELYEKALSLHTENSDCADSRHDSLKDGLKRDIPDVSLYINLARAYRFEKQYENAFKCYEKALELQPDKAFTHYCLALAYLEVQNTVAAEKSLVHSTRLDSEFAEAWYELGLLKARNREFEGAKECLEKVIALNPEDANAWIDLGSLFDCHHESKKAVSCFEKALSLNPVNEKEIWFKLGLAYDALEKFRDAETAYKRALSLCPTYHAALYSLGYHYAFLTHQTEAAMEIFQEGVLSHPEEILFYKALSKLYVERHQWDLAEEILKKAIIENPDALDAQFNLYQFYLEQPIFDDIGSEIFQNTSSQTTSSSKVEAALRSDIQREPDIAEYVFWLADLLDSQMRYTEAVDLLKAFLTGHPHHAEALNFLAALYIDHQSEDPEAEAKAIPLLEKSIALDPNFHTPYYNLGYLMMRGKRHQEAISCFEQALILDPKDFKTHNNLGSLYQMMGDFSKALNCFQKAVKLKPEYYLGYFNLGITHLKLQNGQSAQEAFEQAVALNPNDCFSYRELAKLYQSQWKLKPAIQAFRKYHKLLDALKTEQERKRALQTRAVLGAVLFFILLSNGFNTLESPNSYETSKNQNQQPVKAFPYKSLLPQGDGGHTSMPFSVKSHSASSKGYCKEIKTNLLRSSRKQGAFNPTDPCKDNSH